MSSLSAVSLSRLGPLAVSRSARRRLLMAVVVLLPGGVLNAPPCLQGQVAVAIQSRQPVISEPTGDPEAARRQRLERRFNQDRQKSMVSDTGKLLKLANELNAEMEGARTGELTPDQVLKVAQIEKLAHKVKEKMRQGVGAV
jgi:hypothetical protein